MKPLATSKVTEKEFEAKEMSRYDDNVKKNSAVMNTNQEIELESKKQDHEDDVMNPLTT